MADAVEDAEELRLAAGSRGEAEGAFAEGGGGEDFGFEQGWGSGCGFVAEVETLARMDFAAGADEGGPVGGSELLGEEDFDTAGGVGRVVLGAGAGAGGVEAGGDDAAVVEDEEVAGVEEVGKVREGVVAKGAGGALEDKHAAGAADGGWRLRDEVFGEVVVEVGELHEVDFTRRGREGWRGGWRGRRERRHGRGPAVRWSHRRGRARSRRWLRGRRVWG